MSNSALVTLALDILQCNQTELAEKLKMSKVQVSKWKSGESIPWETVQKLTKMLKIDGLTPEFVLQAGSLKAARKWEKLIIYLAEFADDASENSISCEKLLDEPETLTRDVFDLFCEIGVEIPKEFPSEIDIEGNYEDWVNVDDEDMALHRIELLFEVNPYSSFIRKLFGSLTDVNAFYLTYMFKHIFTDDIMDAGSEIDCFLLYLAATKMKVDTQFAPKFNTFVAKTEAEFEEWINEFKQHLADAGKPLEVEYMDLVRDSGNSLSLEIERKELGFSHRCHPDIYMDELLTNSRRLAKVLPLIMEKLGIEEEEKEYTHKDVVESILFP